MPWHHRTFRPMTSHVVLMVSCVQAVCWPGWCRSCPFLRFYPAWLGPTPPPYVTIALRRTPHRLIRTPSFVCSDVIFLFLRCGTETENRNAILDFAFRFMFMSHELCAYFLCFIFLSTPHTCWLVVPKPSYALTGLLCKSDYHTQRAPNLLNPTCRIKIQYYRPRCTWIWVFLF